MLYIVSTPIGNLEDLSARALKTLRDSDAILCEDTRRTSILLQRYAIKNRLISYHQFKEKSALDFILSELAQGKSLSLVSDAGTPCINDPGLILVQACIAEGIPFTAIPGPCSVIQALVLSGMETERFQYIGFLPKKSESELRRALNYPGTTVALESPERLIHTLETIHKIDPKRGVAVAREMTKMFEECRRGNASELKEHFAQHPPQGEIVLVVEEGEVYTALPLEELIESLKEFHGLSMKEAIKMAAHLLKEPKSVIYKKAHLAVDSDS